MWKFIKNILAPKRCYSCNTQGLFICDVCFHKQNNCEGFCYICKKDSANFDIHKKCLIENKLLNGKNFNGMKIFFDKAIILTHYKNSVIKKLITHFKFFWKKEIWEELSIKLSNLTNAFKINKKYLDMIDKKSIILVDDVISTWSAVKNMLKY